jgi:hypothetical protein
MQFSKIFLLFASIVLFFTACQNDQSSIETTRPSQATQSAPTAQPAVSPSPSAQQKTALDLKREAKVPDSLKRPLTAAEMEKAFQKLPGSVQAQVRGMTMAPTTVRKKQLSKPPTNSAVKK